MASNSCDTASAVLRVDLSALAFNYSLVKKTIGNDCIASGVIKANGYGLGVRPVFDTLRQQGCQHFFVATLDEALCIRSFSKEGNLYTLNGLFKSAENEYAAHNVIPVLGSLEEVERWQDTANKLGRKLPCILHFDTGMNRLGFNAQEIGILLANRSKLLDVLNILFVMTHFISSEDEKDPITTEQTKRFDQIAQNFPGIPQSIANSSGIFVHPYTHKNMVRPGVCLYGGNPTLGNNPMKPVVSLHARILQIHEIKKGETCGYNAQYTFLKDSRTATVSLGYADGFFRANTNSSSLFWNGHACPVRGRVSMDTTIVDISDCPAHAPKAGDWIEVLGSFQGIDALAATANTISYEILTSLGARFQRNYAYESTEGLFLTS